MYHILAILTVCIWGTTFVSTKVLLNAGLSPTEIFCVRFALAYVGMTVICHRHWLCKNWGDEFSMLLAGMAGGSFYFWAENTALCNTRAGTVSFIVCLSPLFTLLLSYLFRLKKDLHPQTWLWTLVALAGVALIVNGEESNLNTQYPLLGVGLSFAASFSWAFYQLIVKHLSTRYSAAVLTRKVFGYGLLTILLFQAIIAPHTFLGDSAFSGLNLNLFLRPIVLSNLLFLGLVASLACYFIWSEVVKKLGAVASANYIYLNPLSTCIFSAAFLGEQFTLTVAAGGAAIITGLYMTARR